MCGQLGPMLRRRHPGLGLRGSTRGGVDLLPSWPGGCRDWGINFRGCGEGGMHGDLPGLEKPEKGGPSPSLWCLPAACSLGAVLESESQVNLG